MRLLELANLLFALLIGVVFHEYMHGRSADLLGDPTPRASGRLTLNPIPHLDLTGSVILPIVILVASGFRFTFGMAKPVPVNARYFKDKRKGMLITGISGPAANFSLAIAAAILLRYFMPGVYAGAYIFVHLLEQIIIINIVLGTFNLLPIPPLDGSHVVQAFIPQRLLYSYRKLEKYGILIIFGIAFLVPGILSVIISIALGVFSLIFLPTYNWISF